MVLWLQLSSKSCLWVPKLSKLNWRAAGAGMPDPNNGFSLLSLPSAGLVGTHVQLTDGQDHISAEQALRIAGLFLSGWVFSLLSDINLMESWHLTYPPWLWLLCVSAQSGSAGSCSLQRSAGNGTPCLHCCLPHKMFLCALVTCVLLWLIPDSSQAWAWSQSSSVWGMQHLHHSWLIMWQERQESLTCEIH